MGLSKLPKMVARGKKRVGRGMGSGKGSHTTGRGTKGQKSRGKIKLGFEGTKTKKSFIKRLPYLRGKGVFKSRRQKTEAINLERLANWPEKLGVSVDNLIKQGMVGKGTERVKILGGGKIKIALDVQVPVSAKAGEKIIKAGGKIDR